MGLGDRIRAWFTAREPYLDAVPAAPAAPPVRLMAPVQFSEGPQLPVDQLLAYFYARQGVIGRDAALRIPAITRGRNLICSVATLPLQAVDETTHRVRRRELFRQYDSNVPNVVAMSQVLEDLLFDAISWWRVVGFDSDGYPSRVQRYAPDQVTLQPPDDYQRGHLPSGQATEGVVWMEGKEVPFDQVIRFDSPNPALLQVGGDVIRRAVALNQAAELYAKTPRRRGYFRPADGALGDPAEDDAIETVLDDWAEASQKRVDGYVPFALKYEAIQDSTPTELQLVQMQAQAEREIANLLGLDPEDLGINTTSRTYQNVTDRRQDRINDTLSPYMQAVTDRLSMPDVTPDGEVVRFFLGGYLRADPKTRAEVQQIYVAMGVTDAAEIRDEEHKPPRTITAPAATASQPSRPAAGLVESPRPAPAVAP